MSRPTVSHHKCFVPTGFFYSYFPFLLTYLNLENATLPWPAEEKEKRGFWFVLEVK